MDYRELQQALEVFRLGSRATLAEIKARHRELVKQHHPDTATGAGDDEAIRRINAAYRLLSDYCGNYRYAFDEEEFLEQNPEERMRRQFATDPLWGRGDRKEKG